MGRFLRLHEDPDDFRRALSFSEAEYGFTQRLIEKDYYCSLILADFEPLFSRGLVFKGGTCLSKVHADFYRLSEDLDFAISVSTAARPRDRREARLPVKDHLEHIAERVPAVSVYHPPQGHDGNRQYNAVLQYESAVTGEPGTVEVQVSVREPVVEPTILSAGRTLLRHPEELPDARLSLRVLSLRETYAEKARAALTRDPPAIRDIFDIDDAVRKRRLDLSEPAFIALVHQKLAVTRIAAIDDGPGRRKLLEDHVERRLKPVLRASDYAAFDVECALAEVERLAALIRRI